jgi:ABC-type Fe3+-hydroxamate transport system substrate-binding protein
MAAQRIVSLVPSQTELLHYLGLGERVVGITKFCIHPAEWHKSKTCIGGTKTVDIAAVLALKPDLIVANKEENVREQVEALAHECTVHTTQVATLGDALKMIQQVGELTGTAEAAQALVQQLRQQFEQLRQQRPVPLRRCAYLIWRKPYMVAGGDTFIHDMLGYAGFENVFADALRYPTCTPEELALRAPEYLLLSSEPFPFADKHIAELQRICPKATIRLVDGAQYSWYGSRLLHFGSEGL